MIPATVTRERIVEALVFRAGCPALSSGKTLGPIVVYERTVRAQLDAALVADALGQALSQHANT